MTGSRFLLDTSVAILVINGDENVNSVFQNASRVYLSVIVFSELYFGALNSTRRQENLHYLESAATKFTMLAIDEETARIAAQIRLQLKKSGKPIPQNDLLIAATALRHGLILATRDGHFDAVHNLLTDPWHRPFQ